jgi:hypothetical protein
VDYVIFASALFGFSSEAFKGGGEVVGRLLLFRQGRVFAMSLGGMSLFGMSLVRGLSGIVTRLVSVLRLRFG